MSITNELNQIKNAIYGKDVRGAIHDAIKQCYDDASVNHDNANMEVKIARGNYKTLNERLNKSDEIQTQINAQLSDVKNTKANESDLEIERKRIDSFTKLQQGATTGDAELIDARIGDNGIVYENLGGAVRTQFNEVKKSLGKYCYRKIKMTNGYNINLSAGVGNVVNLTPEYVSHYNYSIVDCNENDCFTISGTGGNNPRLWGFIDGNNKLLSVADVNETANQKLLIAPKNAVKLIINTSSNSTSYIGGDISEITKNIKKIESTLFDEEIKKNIGHNINLSAGVGNTISLTPSVVAGYNYSIVDCDENDKFIISGTGGNNPRLWGFIDGNNKLLSVAEPYETANQKLLIAPKNAAKLIINYDNNYNNQISFVVSEFSHIKNQLDKVESSLFKKEIVMTNNYAIELGNTGIGNVVTLGPVSLSNYRYSIVDCDENDKFIISGTGGNNPRLWGFIDRNNKLLSVAEPYETANQKLLIAPKNAVKLIINDMKTDFVSYIGIDNEETVDNIRENVAFLLEENENINQNVTKNTIDLEMVSKAFYNVDTRNNVTLFPKDLSVGIGESTFETYNDNGVFIPCWLIPKEKNDQSLVGYVKELGNGYDGVEISITIMNTYDNSDEQSKEVFFALVNSITCDSKMSSQSVFTLPVVSKTPKQGVINRVTLKKIVKLDTEKPFMVSVFRKVDDTEDTNPNPIGIISIDVKPVKSITIQEPNQYSAWPFISAVNDKLVCVYARSKSHTDNTTTDVFKKTSDDGGKTWSREHKIVDTVGVRDTATGKGYDSNGNALFWIRKGAPSSQEETHHLYKTSDGEVFTLVSNPVFDEVPAHIGDIFEVPGVGLVAFYNTLSAKRSWGIVISSDDGVSWEQRQIETNLSFAECPVEVSGVYLGDGRILAIGRKEEASPDGTLAQFQIQSSDFGLNWTKHHTNITDVRSSTSSLIYDKSNDLISQYYYHRGVGVLRLRKSTPSDIWNNPMNWPTSEEIAYGSTNPQDAGNVNAIAYKDKHVAVYYSGDDVNTGIYAKIIE